MYDTCRGKSIESAIYCGLITMCTLENTHKQSSEIKKYYEAFVEAYYKG